MSAEAIAPHAPPIFGRGQIRDARRYRFEPRLERERQAQQRTMQIECGQWTTMRDEVNCAWQRAHQLVQLLRHLQDDSCAKLRDQGHVAAELKRIAETLARRAREWSLPAISSAPSHSGWTKCRLATFSVRFPSPLMFLPPARKVAD